MSDSSEKKSKKKKDKKDKVKTIGNKYVSSFLLSDIF